MLKHLAAWNNCGSGGKNTFEPADNSQNKERRALTWPFTFTTCIDRRLDFPGHFHNLKISSTFAEAFLMLAQIFF
jgi:hypothetical protein